MNITEEKKNSIVEILNICSALDGDQQDRLLWFAKGIQAANEAKKNNGYKQQNS